MSAADPRSLHGRRAEAWVADQLLAEGWRLLGQNLRTPHAEVDLLGVPPPGDVLVLLEVKARHPLAWGTAEEALRPVQRRRLARALEFLAARLGWSGRLRADLCWVELLGGQPASLDRLEDIELLEQ